MATKRRGAPASKPERPKKLTRKEKRIINLAKFRAGTQEAQQELEEKEATFSGLWHAGRGRQTVYTEEMGRQIEECIIEGLSIMKISRLPGMPTAVTMFRWIGEKTHPFSVIYMRAKDLLVARYEEEIQDIADAPLIGEIRSTRQAITPDGEVVTLTETRRADNVERTKLRVAVRQWTLSHLRPKKHGRQAVADGAGANEQLNSLFDSLRAGPTE